MSGRLERSRTNRVISGVCGGIAEYLDIDPTFVRVVFVILAFPFGIGLLIYFVLLFLMPNPGEPTPFVRADGTATTDDPSGAAPAAARPVRATDPAELERRRNGLGILLVAVGALFLLGNLGVFRFIQLSTIWPLVLIAIGV
ncbi:MAG TPA: PspC domain-containing protein, partial [Candidatus Limnocylindria bacterium]